MYREMLVKEKETITRRNQEDASIMNLYNKYTFGINLRLGLKLDKTEIAGELLLSKLDSFIEIAMAECITIDRLKIEIRA